MEKIIVVLEKTDTGFSAYIPELPITCTTGSDLKEIDSNIREALELHIETLKDENLPIPSNFKNQFHFDYRLDIQDFFSLFAPVKQTAVALKAGMNPSLLRQYARGIKHPSLEQAKKIEDAIHELGRDLLKIRLVG